MIFEWQKELKDKMVIIFGASIGGGQLFELLMHHHMKPLGYCDNNPEKHGKEFHGIPIFSVKTAGDMINHDPEQYAVIIASCFFEVMYQQLQEMGVKCEVLIYLRYDPLGLKEQACLYNDDEIKSLMMLYDTEIYTQSLLLHVCKEGFGFAESLGNIMNYIGFGGIDAYYYDELASFIEGERLTFIDAGAYTGDSIANMKNVFGNRIAKIYAFEPNDHNFRELSSMEMQDVVLIKKALYDRAGYLDFTQDGVFFRVFNEGIDLPEQRKVAIETISLDELDLEIQGKCILKLDIEGSELPALKGSKKFIKKHRPYIAVCVYHRVEDIVALPIYLKELVSDYRFILRGGMHTVCYAFPNEI